MKTHLPGSTVRPTQVISLTTITNNACRQFCCLVVLVLALTSTGCTDKKSVSFAGETMGTVYRITAIVGRHTDTGRLANAVEKRLDEINASMSTFREDSEISRFNALREQGAAFPVSDDFARVVRLGQRLHHLSGGAWDGTIWPLVTVWGFDRPSDNPDEQMSLPTSEKIAAARALVDYSLITITNDNRLSKKNPNVLLDLASVAKGYGVDQIAALLRDNGVENFVVEIGGEVFAAGVKKSGQPWVVGINMPRKKADFSDVREAIALSNRAIATSGDYRNYFIVDGQAYSHVLDPKTGYPVKTGVVSASVVAPTCALADGLATALMVMGPIEGLKMISGLADTECLITVKKNADESLTDYSSEGFISLLVD